MNIALIMERIETWRGGAETSTMQFANHLARLGCGVTVVTASHVPSTPALTIVPIKVSTAPRATRTLLFARRAAAYVRKHDFDVVHSITPCVVADVYQPRGGTVPEMLARNVAVRSTPAGRLMKRLSQRMSVKYRQLAGLERRLLARRPPPWVIAISQYVSDQLRRHYDFDPARVRLIFNGVDPDQTPPEDRREHRREIRRRFGLADDDLVALCVANNFKLKGVGKLIEALAHRRAKRPGGLDSGGRTGRTTSGRPVDMTNSGHAADHTYAVIVGRDNPAPLAKLAQRLDMTDRVLFAGPSQRIGAFYHAADLLVHPTFYDPCSRVVLEAMAAGLPVITTRFNGAAERITDGREGYVIESPDDAGVIADRIDRLADGARRRACGKHAAQAVTGITMAQHAANVLALYEEIIASSEARQPGYR